MKVSVFLRTNYQVGSEGRLRFASKLRRYDLRSGDLIIRGTYGLPGHRTPLWLIKVETINGLSP
jgi:transcription termination factor Rho